MLKVISCFFFLKTSLNKQIKLKYSHKMANVMPSDRQHTDACAQMLQPSMSDTLSALPAAPVTMFGVCLSCHDRQIYIFISSRQPSSCHLSWTMTVFYTCAFYFSLLCSTCDGMRQEDTRWADTNADLTPQFVMFEDETFEEEDLHESSGDTHNYN